MSRTVALVAMALALTASRARAQSQGPESHAPNVLSTVVVTAKAPSNNLFRRFWHMNEDRNQVIAMEQENRRLAWQLRGYDKQVVRLESKLAMVKAEHDRKVDGITAIETEAAETRRRRMELEDRLKKLEGASVASNGVERK
jgi:predicted RNase H-like nuclease (RuvC/YqgF family)